MQLKTLALVAASLAVASAQGWGDEGVDSSTKPVEVQTTKSQVPDGGKTSSSVADTTAASSTWSDASWSETTTSPVADKTTTSATKSWTKPVDGGSTTSPVADTSKTTTTTSASSSSIAYWGDESDLPVEGGKKTTTTTPAASTVTTSATWGDHSIPVTETETTTVELITSIWTKPDGGKETTTISSTKTITKTIYLTPSATPVSGGEGKPPVKPEVPVGGGGCGVVTVTETSTKTVTVPAGGKPTAPAATTPVPAEVTWQDHPTGFQTSAAAVPSAAPQGGYMDVVSEWRAKLGLKALEHDSTLEANALDTAQSSGGGLNHKLNPGSMAQVLAPGDMSDFTSIFVGGWLCEVPSLPGLGSQVCDTMSKGWNYGGQTGHADIISSGDYSKIGCAAADGICSCDFA